MALICELDEQWSFVGSKAQQHWLWYAYNTKTGGVLACTFGPRTDETCRELLVLLTPFNIGMLTTDEWGSYTREGANKQVISSQADSLIKISRIWADFFPANTSNQPI